MFLTSLAGALFRETQSQTPLSELFTYVSYFVSSIFLVLILCSLLAPGADGATQWYSVQIVQLVLLMKHYSAFASGSSTSYFIIGPYELVFAAVGLLACRGVYGVAAISAVFDKTWSKIIAATATSA